MSLIGRRTPKVVALVIALALGLTMGCGAKTTVAPTSGATTYGGALDTTYPNALDVTSQLALGTLKLEGTENAVTEAQAAQLLPLWEALSGTAAETEAERTGLVQQIEDTMTATQVSAIAAMALTQADEQAWTPSQALTGGFGAGGPITGTTLEGWLPAAVERLVRCRAAVESRRLHAGRCQRRDRWRPIDGAAAVPEHDTRGACHAGRTVRRAGQNRHHRIRDRGLCIQ